MECLRQRAQLRRLQVGDERAGGADLVLEFNDDALGSLTAGTLPAHKTRIALMLGLSQGMNAQALQAWLDRINEH